jgi:hypothetical protein
VNPASIIQPTHAPPRATSEVEVSIKEKRQKKRQKLIGNVKEAFGGNLRHTTSIGPMEQYLNKQLFEIFH